jgi:hypothetical protein
LFLFTFVPFFLIDIVGGGVQLGPLGTAATNRPIVLGTGDYDDGQIGGMIGKENRSTQRKPAPVPLCPPQIPHTARMRTRAAAVGSQRLTAWAMARPNLSLNHIFLLLWKGMKRFLCFPCFQVISWLHHFVVVSNRVMSILISSWLIQLCSIYFNRFSFDIIKLFVLTAQTTFMLLS